MKKRPPKKSDNGWEKLEFLDLDSESVDDGPDALDDAFDDFDDDFDDDYDDDYDDYDEGSYDAEAYDDEAYDESYDDEDYDDAYDDDYDDYDDDDDYGDYEDEEPFDEDADEYVHEDRGPFSLKEWFLSRTVADYVIMGGAIAAAILFVAICAMFFGKQGRDRQYEMMADVGSNMDRMNVIGESGLLAFADLNKEQVAEFVEEELNQEEEGEEPADLNENKEKIAVMNLTSIQKDLKIKIVDNDLGRLISGVEFEVEISDPKGKQRQEKDTDKDGIIYLTELEAGKYQVALTGPEDGEYRFSKDAISINVKGTIEYKKVDIKDEIKKESEINAAVEDTQQKTETESQLTDTVEYVESTRTLIEGTERDEYEAVKREDIADPTKTAYLGMKQLGKRYDDPPEEPQEETDPTEVPEKTPEPTEEPDPTEPPEEPTPTPEETPEPTEEPIDEPDPTEPPTPSPTKGKSDLEEVDETPRPTPTKKPEIEDAEEDRTPTPTPTVTPSEDASATPSVTPTPTATASKEEKAKNDKTSILKTTKGDELYIKDGDNWRKAVYADYFDTNLKFYKKVTTGEYRYTGWQTIDGYRYYFDRNGNPVTGEQVIQGAKYEFDSSGRISTGSGILGIDVSKWNGSIDWEAVRNSGVSFVIIRCGYRGSATGALVEDPKFRTNINGALNAGLKVGIYFFSQAVNEVEAVEEASMVLSLIGGYNISYPVYLDVEGSGGRGDNVSVDTRTAVCHAFCKTIQNSGYKAGVYANKTWFNNYINTPSLTGYKLWLAQYAAQPSYSRTRYDMWQYSSSGSVGGIGGRVDMNISYLGY